jgi:cellulose synthase operon protein C
MNGMYRRRSSRTGSRARWAAVVCAVFVLVGCEQKGPAADALETARLQMASMQYREAIRTLKFEIQSRPLSAEARYLLGLSTLEAGDGAAAAVELKKALELGSDPNLAVPALVRALVVSNQGRELIESPVPATLSSATALAEVETWRSVALVQLGRQPEASQAAQDAMRADPKHIPARLQMARIEALSANLDAAAARVQAVLAEQPGNAEAHVLQGEVIEARSGDLTQARAAYEAAIKADRTHGPAYDRLLGVLLAQGEIGAAGPVLTQLREILPDSLTAHFYAGRLAMIQGNPRAALESAQILLKAAPREVRYLNLAGEAALASGALNEADLHLSQSVALSPTSGATRLMLATTYVQMGTSAEALKLLAPMLAVPKPHPLVLSTAAMAHLQAGNAAQAERLFAQAASQAPASAQLQASLALMESMRGNNASALRTLEQLGRDQKSVLGEVATASVKARAKDIPGAVKALEAAAAKQPTNPNWPTMQGRLLAGSGDLAGARQRYERALSLQAAYEPALLGMVDLDMRAKQPEAALRRVDAALAAVPDSWRIRLLKAELQARAEAPDDAVRQTLEEAVRTAGGQSAPHQRLVNFYLNAGQLKPALQAAQAAHAALPGSVDLGMLLARTHAASGEQRQAVAVLQQLSVTHPKNASVFVQLAQLHTAQREFGAARGRLANALDIDPRSMEAWGGLVDLALAEGQPKAALEVARRVQTQFPDRPEGHVWESEAHAAAKSWPAMIAALKAAWGKRQDSAIAARLYSAHVAAGQQAEAERLAQSWLARHADDALFLFVVGNIAADQGRLPDAQAMLQRAVTADPQHADALNNLAWVLTKQGAGGAVDFAERANRLRPGRAAYMDTLAAALAAEGQLQRALDVQTRALAIEPSRQDLRLNLARLAVKAGDKVVARRELATLAALGAQFPARAEVLELLKAAQAGGI